MGQVLCPEKKTGKAQGYRGAPQHTPTGAGRAGGRTHPHTTATALRRRTAGRAGKAQGTPQDRGTAPHRSTAPQKKAQESTQEYIEVCYSSSVEHKGTDHTVTPNHSTCSPQRGHGTRHQSLRCVLFCVQAGHGIAVGTTQTQNAMRGEEGAAFLPIK